MINTIAISGNLAQDPEVRLGKNLNESYVTFSLCIHFYNGEEYVKCIAGGKTADYLIKNAKKVTMLGLPGKSDLIGGLTVMAKKCRSWEYLYLMQIGVQRELLPISSRASSHRYHRIIMVDSQCSLHHRIIRIVQQLIREHVKAISRGRIRMSRMMSTVNLFRHILITMKQRGDKSAEKSQ